MTYEGLVVDYIGSVVRSSVDNDNKSEISVPLTPCRCTFANGTSVSIIHPLCLNSDLCTGDMGQCGHQELGRCVILVDLPRVLLDRPGPGVVVSKTDL